jgi:hypothetical protein
MRTEKRCPVCERTLPWEAFGRDITPSIGIKGICKECHNTKTRQRYGARSDAEKSARRARDRATYARRKA